MGRTFYPEDEFPINYNPDTKEKSCIGYCIQCPLFVEYAKTGYDKVDCDKILYEMCQ